MPFIKINTLAALALGAVATMAGALESVGSLPTSAVEARNTVAGFVLPAVATLGMLRVECAALLPDPRTGAEAIAQGWWARNRADFETATVWADRYLSYLKENDAEGFRRAQGEMLRQMSDAVLTNTRLYFRREAPTAQSCDDALQQYARPEHDIQKIHLLPDMAKYSDYGPLLKRMRAEPGYEVPARLKREYAAAVRYQMLASLDAAQAARNRKDGATVSRIYQSMAQRGDGTAAQVLGGMYAEGELLPKDEALAYRWYYTAWTLADYTALQSLGAMWRDGRGVPGADTRLAYASFVLGAAVARTDAQRKEAAASARELEPRVAGADRTWVACLRLKDMDAALQRPVSGARAPRGVDTPDAQRRLGQIAPALAAAVPASGCG